MSATERDERAPGPHRDRRPLASWRASIRSWAYLKRRASAEQIQQIHALSRNPIVIGGCGRSGTTLLLSILSCHRHLLAIDEETRALCVAAEPWGREPRGVRPLRLHRLYRELLAQPIPPEARRWCEKTPSNVHSFHALLDHFGPGARAVHVVRDGRDVITSRHPSEPGQFWVSPERWVRDVTAGRRAESHPQVTAVRYEDLVLDYPATIRRLCGFLGEPFDEALLDYPHSARIAATLEGKAWFQGRERPHPRSIGRWRAPEHAERIAALLALPGAREALEHYGYSSEA